MKTSTSLTAAVLVVVVLGLVVWASMAREPVPTGTVFDVPATETPVEESTPPSESRQAAQDGPSDPLEHTVRTLSQEVTDVRASAQSSEDDPIAKAEQAIARVDALLTASGIPVAPAPAPPSESARNTRLDELQTRLDELPR